MYIEAKNQKMHIEGNFFGLSVSFLLGVGTSLLLTFFYQQIPIYEYNDVISIQENTLNLTLQEENNHNVTHQESMFGDLLPLLESAATEDKTVIMTSVNWAWAQPDSLLDMFLQSFQNGDNIDHLLKHLVIVAFDAKAFERCKLLHPYCFRLKVDEDFSGNQGFMTKGYNDLVWSKISLQQYILQQGYNFFFTDVDVMWFRNPLKHVTLYADLTLSSEVFNGDPDSEDNAPNTGLVHVKSSNKTLRMMKHWLEARERFNSGRNHDQGAFNDIKHELVESFGIKIQYVDTKYFGGFCNYGKDLNKIVTLHANCCFGLENKIEDFRVLLEDWKFFMSLSVEDKKKGLVQWRVPGKCIH